jgi:DNA-binding beta-propeller fold protein YncE
MGASIYTSAMVLPYNAAAGSSLITTLDRLESEGNRFGRNNPGFDIGFPLSDIAVDSSTNIVYIAQSSSPVIAIIDTNTQKVSFVIVGYGAESIAINEIDHTAYVANCNSNAVYVINWTIDGNYRNIANITVGD